MDIISESEQAEAMRWYVMRDLKRRNSRNPAYSMLGEAGFEVFTPMKWEVFTSRGRKVRERVPYVQDLLFVHSDRESLDRVVSKTGTLQYRFVRGGSYCQPMVVSDREMERFIAAVGSTDNPVYYLPGELTPSMVGRAVRIIGGPLDGYEGNLLSVRGSREKRLIVELPEFFSAGVEVDPEYIELIKQP